jgi:hypothetical protein
MAAFVNIPRKRKVYEPRRTCSERNYRDLYRFEEENDVWIAQNFLVASDERRGGRAL